MKHFLLSSLLFLIMYQYSVAQVANHLVIAELYGGGGDQGSYWKNDFVHRHRFPVLGSHGKIFQHVLCGEPGRIQDLDGKQYQYPVPAAGCENRIQGIS